MDKKMIIRHSYTKTAVVRFSELITVTPERLEEFKATLDSEDLENFKIEDHISDIAADAGDYVLGSGSHKVEEELGDHLFEEFQVVFPRSMSSTETQ